MNKVIRNNMFEETKYQELHDPVNAFINELKALEISLLEEKACIDYYAMFVEVFRDASIRELFQRVLMDTRNHLELLSDEYLRRREIGSRQGATA